MRKRLLLWGILVFAVNATFTSGDSTQASGSIKNAVPKDIPAFRDKIMTGIQRKLSSLENSVEQINDELKIMDSKNNYLEKSLNGQQAMLYKLDKGITSIENLLLPQENKLNELKHTFYPDDEIFALSNMTCGGVLHAQAGYVIYNSVDPLDSVRNLRKMLSGQATMASCIWTIQANHRSIIKLTADVLDLPYSNANGATLSGAYVLEGMTEMSTSQRTSARKLVKGATYTFKGPFIFVVLFLPDNTKLSYLTSIRFHFKYESHGHQTTKNTFFSHRNINAHLVSWRNFSKNFFELPILASSLSNLTVSNKELTFTSIVLSNVTTKLRLQTEWERERCADTFLSVFPITDLLFSTRSTNGSRITNLCDSSLETGTNLFTGYGKPVVILISKPYEQAFPLNLSWTIDPEYPSSYVETSNSSETTKTCGSVLGGSKGYISYKPEVTYRPGERCVWAIVPQPAPSTYINITFLQSKTNINYNSKEANNYDHVYVMELTTIEGHERVDGPKITRLNSLTNNAYKAQSREVYIVFYSDSSVTSNGFTVNWEASGDSIDTGGGILTQFNFISENEGTMTLVFGYPNLFSTFYQVFIFISILPSPIHSTPNYVFGMNFQLNHTVPETTTVSDGNPTCIQNGFLVFAPSSGDGGILQTRNAGCYSPGKAMIKNADGMAVILAKSSATDENHESITMNFSWSQEFREGDPRVVKLENNKCGGVIIGERGILRYKLEQKYNRNEHCLWLLQCPNSTRISLKLMKDGFGVDDHLFVNTIDADAGVLRDDAVQLRTLHDEMYNFTEPLLVISFRPSPTNANGSGFILQFWSSQDHNDQGGLKEHEDQGNVDHIEYRLRHSEIGSGSFLYDWKNQSSHAPGKQLHVIAYSSGSAVNVAVRPPTTKVKWVLGVFQKDKASCNYDSISFYTTLLINSTTTTSARINAGQLWKQSAFFPGKNSTQSCPNQVRVTGLPSIATANYSAFLVIYKLVASPVEEDSGGDERKIEFSHYIIHTRITDFIPAPITAGSVRSRFHTLDDYLEAKERLASTIPDSEEYID